MKKYYKQILLLIVIFTSIYTAYFFAPEIGQWELIAGFRRPQTTTYLSQEKSQ